MNTNTHKFIQLHAYMQSYTGLKVIKTNLIFKIIKFKKKIPKSK